MVATPLSAQSAQGEFHVGPVFARAWGVFTANFVKFVIVTALVEFPTVLFDLSVSSALLDSFRLPLGFILMLVAQAMVTYMAFNYWRGNPASITDALQRGCKRLVPIVAMAILALVIITVGLIALVAPGVALMLCWAVAMPACVIERLGPIASLKRSFDLTEGHRWRIFAIGLPMWLLTIAVRLAIEHLADPLGPIVSVIGNYLWTTVWTGYSNTVWVMAYHDLRVAKEGSDIEQIAAVFD